MTIPLDPFSEVVDERRRWTPDWYSWLQGLSEGGGDLEARVTILEGDVANIQTDITNLDVRIDALEAINVFNITTNTTLSNTHHKGRVCLSGNTFFTLTVPSATTPGLEPKYVCYIFNADDYPGGRGKKIVVTGGKTFILWPGQSISLYLNLGFWQAAPSDPVPLRWTLPANVELYVNTSTGNNANDGLATGSGNALQTVQQAINYVARLFDIGANNVNINVGASFTESVAVNGPWSGLGQVTILGNVGSPSSIVWTSLSAAGSQNLSANNLGQIYVKAFKFVNGATGGIQLAAGTFGAITVTGTVDFGATGGQHMGAATGGQINCNNLSYTISGGGGNHVFAFPGGNILNQGNTLTITGTPAFAQFAATNSGVITINGNTYPAPAPGPGVTSGGVAVGTVKFLILNGGAMAVNGASRDYLPGDQSSGTGGTTTGGGYYA